MTQHRPFPVRATILCATLLVLTAWIFPTAARATCTGSDTALCLTDDRFVVTVEWVNPYPAGGAGQGRAVELTDDSGTFWFFNQDNVELVVKILDGRSINGFFWVFYASLSTVEFTITINDTSNLWQRTYHNPPFQQTTGADTSAFSDVVTLDGLLDEPAH